MIHRARTYADNDTSKIRGRFAAVLGAGVLFAAAIAATPFAPQAQAEALLSDAQRSLSVVAAPKSDLDIDGWVNHKSAKYKIGEVVDIYIRANLDAYVTIFSVDAEGKSTMIFPNKFNKVNKIAADTVMRVPGDAAKFKLQVGGPSGANLLKILASTDNRSFEEAIVFAFNSGFGQFEGETEKLADQIKDVVTDSEGDNQWATADIAFEVLEN